MIISITDKCYYENKAGIGKERMTSQTEVGGSWGLFFRLGVRGRPQKGFKLRSEW